MNLRQAKPTGKRRFRQSWNGRLILQIQFEGFVTSYFSGHCDTQHATAWRDADIRDITIDEAHEAGAVHAEYFGPGL